MTISYQFLSLLAMIASGVATGFFVESFRDSCQALRPRAFLRRYQGFFEVILWLGLGIASFYLLFHLRDGSWRIYDPCAQIVGIILYELWFRKPLLVLRRVIMRLIVQPIWWIILLLVAIIRTIVRVLIKILMVILWPLFKLVKQLMKLFEKIPRKPLKK
jgi:hypothetical protein